MALPNWPEPPRLAAMSSMRLSMTSVPSSPLVVRSACAQQAGAAGEYEPRRAAHADELRAARQPQFARAVFARSEHERHARASGLVDGVLQHVGLLGAAAGANAKRCGVDPERR